jgi:preprotein translocase subunit SecY
MFNAVANLFRIPELRKRLLVTFALLVVYRVGWNIPLPGIDPEKMSRFATTTDNPLLRFLDIIGGGGLQKAALFSLGIMPYISASIIFSLLVKVIPSLEKLSKEGSAGQRKINQWTRYSTIPICIVQGAFAIRQFTGQTNLPLPGGGHQFTFLTFGDTGPDFWLRLGWIIAMTTGTIFMMWIGEEIDEFGVGNGISLIIMAGIVARLPHSVVGSDLGAAQGFLLAGLFLLIVLGVVFITKGQRKIPVQYAKLTRGRRVYGGQRHYMPIRVNMAGVMPVIFASALLTFPPLLFEAIGLQALASAFHYGEYLWAVFYVVLTFFFAFFWVALMFNPVEMSKNMKESGSFIPGIRPGRPTAEYLERIMNRITLAGAAFLGAIAVLPVLIASTLKLPTILTVYLGGTTILIVVSVALDLVDKLNSYLVMRNYEGFLRGAARRGDDDF